MVDLKCKIKPCFDFMMTIHVADVFVRGEDFLYDTMIVINMLSKY